MRLSKFSKVALTSVAALSIAGGVTYVANADATPAAAPAPALTGDAAAVVEYMRGSLTRFGVTPQVQETLVAKVLSGGQLDADLGAEAVSQRSFTDADGEHTIYTYADGSAAMGTMDVPVTVRPGEAGTKSIRNCVHTRRFDQNWYKNCDVAWNAATWSMSYVADFDFYQFGAHITKMRGITVGGIGMDKERTEIITGNAQGHFAVASARGVALQSLTIAGLGVTRNVGINLKVSSQWRKAKESSFGG